MRTINSKLLLLLFPLGLVAGYLIPRSETKETSSSNKDALSTRSNEIKRPRNTIDKIDETRIRSLAERISNRKIGEWIDYDDIAIGDISSVIDELMSQSGPSGLPFDVQASINDLLTKWAKEDFNSAYTWAMSHPNRNAAKDFLEPILVEHARMNFDDTVALIHQLKDESNIILNLGDEMFEFAAARGAQDAFKLLSACPPDGRGASGLEYDFPSNFDYKTFAELTAAHLKKNGVNPYSAFSSFPMNLLEEWAKVDVNAALEFYVSNEGLPYCDLGDITKSFLDITKPETAYPWLSEQYANLNKEERVKFSGELNTVFPSAMGSAPLIHLVKTLPTQALQKEMVGDMLQSYGYGYRTQDTYIDLLPLLETPQERLDAINNNPRLAEKMRRLNDNKLSRYGISREQIKIPPQVPAK